MGLDLEGALEGRNCLRGIIGDPGGVHLRCLGVPCKVLEPTSRDPTQFWCLRHNSFIKTSEKCGRASPIRNILAKVLGIYVFPVKTDKNHRKICKLFTVWFPKELAMSSFSGFRPDLGPKSPRFPFSFFSAVTQRISKNFFLKSIRIFTPIDWA